MPTSFFNNLKIDKWWKGILWLSIFFILSSFFFSPNFLKSKHLFGFGLGLLFIGFSYWVSEKTQSQIKPANAYTGNAGIITYKYIKHDLVTIILLTLGIILSILFGFLIIKNLI